MRGGEDGAMKGFKVGEMVEFQLFQGHGWVAAKVCNPDVRDLLGDDFFSVLVSGKSNARISHVSQLRKKPPLDTGGSHL